MSSEQREFNFTRKQFVWVRDKLYEHCGIVLSDHKESMVYNRLVRRVRDLKLDGFDSYLSYLESHPAEFNQFVNALTTNLTAFFREAHHFDFVRDHVVPQIRQSGRRNVRCWSAGCSLGEETYSLAITLAESFANMPSMDWRIHATDIDSDVLAHGSSGVYMRERLNAVPERQLHRWFLKGSGAQAGKVKIKPELRRHIDFQQVNLMADWPIDGPLDFIFCRNVMIYFDQQTQARLLGRMAELLRPNAYLFIGHSESINKLTDRFRLVGKTIYQKVK